MKSVVNNFFIKKEVNLFFFPNRSLFFIKGGLGAFVVRMPSLFFFKNNKGNFSFLFLNNFSFNLFFKHVSNCLTKLSKIFFFRIRIKGLGYRIRKISSGLFRFFFTSTNFFYFHVPKNVLVKYKMRRMLLISNEIVTLKVLIAHLLLLKKLIPYFLRGVFSPRNIIVLKPGKKAF